MMLELAKKYGVLVVAVGYLGLGQYFEGLQPMFRFQLEAHAQETEREMAQTSTKLDQIACFQVIAGFIIARRDDDAVMMAHWIGQAKIFNCTLPS